MQAPPPTTLDPLTQQKIIDGFNRGAQRTFDTGIDFVRIMVIAVAVVVGFAALVIVLFVLALWRRAQCDPKLQDAGDLLGLSR
jgi:phage shock protein PspC (stress-responsive transcriptional regulator)